MDVELDVKPRIEPWLRAVYNIERTSTTLIDSPAAAAAAAVFRLAISSLLSSDLFGLEWRGSEVKSTPSTKKTIWLQERHGAPV